MQISKTKKYKIHLQGDGFYYKYVLLKQVRVCGYKNPQDQRQQWCWMVKMLQS